MTTDEPVLRRAAPRMPNAVTVAQGVATGGQPDAAELEALARAGWRTIIDTRLPGEPRGYDEPAAASRLGLDYVALPIGDVLADEVIEAVRAALVDAHRRPVLVHCASGNRVGAAMIPYLILDEGRSPDEALAMAVRMGLRSAGLAGQAMAYVKHRRPEPDGQTSDG